MSIIGPNTRKASCDATPNCTKDAATNASDSEHNDRKNASPIMARMLTTGRPATPLTIVCGTKVCTAAEIVAPSSRNRPMKRKSPPMWPKKRCQRGSSSCSIAIWSSGRGLRSSSLERFPTTQPTAIATSRPSRKRPITMTQTEDRPL